MQLLSIIMWCVYDWYSMYIFKIMFLLYSDVYCVSAPCWSTRLCRHSSQSMYHIGPNNLQQWSKTAKILAFQRLQLSLTCDLLLFNCLHHLSINFTTPLMHWSQYCAASLQAAVWIQFTSVFVGFISLWSRPTSISPMCGWWQG